MTLDAWAAGTARLRGRLAMQALIEPVTKPSGGEAMQPSHPTDLFIVEGAMGLFDGAAAERIGKGSVADLALALDAPVILVVDASHMAQSAGAVVEGMVRWAEAAGIVIAGVILNRLGSSRHEALVRYAVASVSPVFGALPRDAGLAVPSRHLGLVQAGEHADLEAFIDRAANWVVKHCDMGAIQAAAKNGPANGQVAPIPPLGQRIAVARDQAFGFAYWHMLEDWRNAGAELVVFSPLSDEVPDPEADAVFLPGGYPELHAGRLASATHFLGGLRDAAERGALIYGECGGFMVLGDALTDANGKMHAMAGLIRLETSFSERRLQLGYRTLWSEAGPWRGSLKAHEFHYSTATRAEGHPLFQAQDATGKDLGPIGLRAGRVMGSYAHVIEVAG